MADDAQAARSPPPLLERVAVMHFEPFPIATFNQKADEWQAKIATEYGDRDVLQEWKLNIPEKNGIPDFAALQTDLILHRRFWKAAGEKRAIAMQCRNGWVSFNVVNHEGKRHRYVELTEEVSRCLPDWAQHFGVQHFSEYSLIYVNRLSKRSTPQFFDLANGNETLHLGNVLTAFGQAPYPGTIVPPYTYALNLQLDSNQSKVLNYTVNSVPNKSEPEEVMVDVRLGMKIKAGKHEDTPAHAVMHLDYCHEKLLDAYKRFFTQNALQSFEGI